LLFRIGGFGCRSKALLFATEQLVKLLHQLLETKKLFSSASNGFIESFNGRLADECVNVEWFSSLEGARQKLAKFHEPTITNVRTARWRTGRQRRRGTHRLGKEQG
jgi:hypothetical protein